MQALWVLQQHNVNITPQKACSKRLEQKAYQVPVQLQAVEQQGIPFPGLHGHACPRTLLQACVAQVLQHTARSAAHA